MTMQKRSNVAIIMITHDLSVIWKMAPYVIVLKNGEVVEAGETARVFAHPQSAYTASLIAAATLAHNFANAGSDVSIL